MGKAITVDLDFASLKSRCSRWPPPSNWHRYGNGRKMEVMFLSLGSMVVGGFGLNYAVPHFWRHYQIMRLRERLADDRSVILTYDDGPGKVMTPLVVDLLATWNARAVFFCLGQRATFNPEIVDLICGRGHEVACHSKDHLHPWRTLPWQAAVDCDAGFRLLKRWLPPAPFYRPPYGKWTALTWLAARRHNGRPLWWTIDSEDTGPSLPMPETIAAGVARAGGGVVLLHDFDRRRPERANYVLNTTEAILKMAAREGIRVTCRPPSPASR